VIFSGKHKSIFLNLFFVEFRDFSKNSDILLSGKNRFFLYLLSSRWLQGRENGWGRGEVGGRGTKGIIQIRYTILDWQHVATGDIIERYRIKGTVSVCSCQSCLLTFFKFFVDDKLHLSFWNKICRNFGSQFENDFCFSLTKKGRGI
jgi:hypothetical protein